MADQVPAAGFVLSNKMYDKMKFLVRVVLPALAVLYASLSEFWGFPKVQEVVGSISALALFMGLLLGMSSKNFTPPSGTGTPVGNFVVVETVEGKKTVNLDLTRDPADFIDNDTITFHLKKEELPAPEVEDERGKNLP